MTTDLAPFSVLPSPSPVAESGLPMVIVQALDDRRLARVSRGVMWKLRLRLDFLEFRPLKMELVAFDVGIKPQQAGRAMRELVQAGYLDQQPGAVRPGCYRMPWSRRAVDPATLPAKRRGRQFDRRSAAAASARGRQVHVG
jgi:hypothetical protein